jgi:release factor glutamine methyltransferase
MNTVSQLLSNAISQLESDSPRTDAEILLSFVLQKNTAWLFAHSDHIVSLPLQQAFLMLLNRRKAGEPIAHIIGARGFWNLDLVVTPDTLIPRPETELLVELAIAKCTPHKKLRVLDLGTGSGAIALAIASECKNADVIAVDKSEAALLVAKENALRNKLSVQFMQSDWFASSGNQKFDLIVSNPPYIANLDPHLTQGDLRFEPLTALASGADGLDDIRHIISHAANHCLPNAWLMIEHGFDQGERIGPLFSAAAFSNIETLKDLEQRDRVTIGQWLCRSHFSGD